MAQLRQLTEVELRFPTRMTQLISRLIGAARKTLLVVDELGSVKARIWIYAAPSVFSENETFVRHQTHGESNFFLEDVPKRIELLQKIQAEVEDIKMQAERKIFNEQGEVIFHAIADPAMSGISVEVAAIWHTAEHLMLYKTYFDELSIWLADAKELEKI